MDSPPKSVPDAAPSAPADLLALAREQRDARKLAEAEATCRRVIGMRATDAEAHLLLATILHAQDHPAAAVASIEEAIRLDPRSPEALKELAITLAAQGRISEAVEADRRALELCPGDIGAFYHLARLKTFSAGDPDLEALEALARDRGTFEEAELIGLLFTLAKAYEDTGENARSFGYLREANALKRSTYEYDVAADIRFLEEIAETYQADLLAELAGAGSPSELPILIVGMPRSGTTLVEQILASHPAVYGGGELEHLQDLAAAVSLFSDRGLGFPEGFPDGSRQLRSKDLARFGYSYVERLRAVAPDAERVTDKNLMNFRYLGLARLIVPAARVIHCTRDPRDTCLSSYSSNFKFIKFAFSLDELGRYYRAYARLMEHWRAVLPAGWMLEVSYESLVADLEGGARRIVDHCGLPWDVRCLNFHTAERSVRTASVAQVRRPIYGTSVARWRRYEPHLGPLLDALAD